MTCVEWDLVSSGLGFYEGENENQDSTEVDVCVWTVIEQVHTPIWGTHKTLAGTCGDG